LCCGFLCTALTCQEGYTAKGKSGIAVNSRSSHTLAQAGLHCHVKAAAFAASSKFTCRQDEEFFRHLGWVFLGGSGGEKSSVEHTL